MKPHPRIRKTVKWGGAVVTMLLVVVWIGSGYFGLGWSAGSKRFEIATGTFTIWTAHWHRYSDPSGLRALVFYPYETHWGFAAHPYSEDRFCMPLWLLAVTSLAASCVAWRLDVLSRGRSRFNLCPKCHYDRTGLVPGAVCPECGAPSS